MGPLATKGGTEAGQCVSMRWGDGTVDCEGGAHSVRK